MKKMFENMDILVYWAITCVVAFVVFVSALSQAHAAEAKIWNYEDGKVYVGLDGGTEEGDLDRLKETIVNAMATSKFTGHIHLRGPGGDAREGAKIAEYIRKMGFSTIARDECVSACSLIWMSGQQRFIQGDSRVGFHFAYTSDVDFLEDQLKLNGWHGIQDGIAKLTHKYTAELFKYGIAMPYEFLNGLHTYGEIKGAYWINKDNISIVGGIAY